MCGTYPREAWVNYTCATNGLTQILSVSEPITCKYNFVLAVECARNRDYPGTLCVAVSATPSPTTSASRTRSATQTPTSSKSTGTSDSPSPSSTPSNTGTASNTPTTTGTPTPTTTFVPLPAWMGYMRAKPQTWALTSGTGFLAYRVNPYSDIFRTNVDGSVSRLGYYTGWTRPLVADATCPSGMRYFEQQYTGGSLCQNTVNGPVYWQSRLQYSCSADSLIRMSTTVVESPPCTLTFTISIDCRCVRTQARLQRLCVLLPSITAQ